MSQLTTLSGVVSSLIINTRLYLYEHQSTYNPNLPYRFLEYISELYSKMVLGKNIYGRTRISLPTPRFIVFYNGKEELNDVLEMKLSDMYLKKRIRSLNLKQGCSTSTAAGTDRLWRPAGPSKIMPNTPPGCTNTLQRCP